jgi:hypothetical protein
MARSGDWQLPEMAQGDPRPAWPLTGLKPSFSLTSFGGGRPFGCAANCERWHAGIDLTGAKDGQVVIAPEAGTIVGIDKGWSEGSKAVFLRTDTGLFLVLGGTKLGSGKEFEVQAGTKVKKGQPLGRVLGSYGMIHLETYADPQGTRTKNTPWPVNSKPPPGLDNPTWYVQDMVGQPHVHLTSKQKLKALKQLGWYKGDIDAAWGVDATEALKAAQKAYGLVADGLWGEKTEAAIQHALGGGNMPKPPAQPQAPDVPTRPSPARSGGVWPFVIGGTAVLCIGAAIAVSVGRRKR